MKKWISTIMACTFFVASCLLFSQERDDNPEKEIKIDILQGDVDLDVDSDNDNALESPDRSNDEDKIEDDNTRSGKYVMVNDGDEDEDGVPDFADFDGSAGFTRLVLELPPTIDVTKAKIKFTYDASDPNGVTEGGTAPFKTYAPASGNLRIWTKNGNQARNKASVGAETSGDYVPADTFDASKLGFTAETRVITLYIEGIAPSASLGASRILAEVDPDGDGPKRFVMSDAVRLSVVSVDLDVDTDNNKALNTPDRDALEDGYEYYTKADKTWPCKVVVVNDGDLNNNFIPDYADFTAGSGAFTPVVLEVPAPIDLTKAKIKLRYWTSDPDAVTRTGTSPEYEYAPGSGKIRLWTKDANVARNKASVAAATPGDYVPDSTFTPAQLGLGGTTRHVTLYIEGMAPSLDVAITDIRLEVDPDGDGPADFMVIDQVRITVMKVDLLAANSNEATEVVPGTPVLLNDDWDGGHKYGATPPAGHREKEPIWDKDYTAAQVPAEDDLMKVTVAIAPTSLTGNVTQKITSGAASIRLWPRATKGTDAEKITIPSPGGQTYAIATDLPKDLYVEGIVSGRAVMTLEYTVGTTTYTDTANIDVVRLQERQGGTVGAPVRKVINAYNTEMDFDVLLNGTNNPDANYTYRWDLDGDGTRNNGAWENGTGPAAQVKYSSTASGAGNVQLVKNAANRRKTYNIAVKLKGGELKGGLVVSKTIRVALDSYEGTAVATTTAGRRTEVAGSATPPAGFTNTAAPRTQAWFETQYGLAAAPPATTINAGNWLQYATLVGGAYGITPYWGTGGNRQVYLAMLGPAGYTAGFRREDLASIAEHEIQHCRQHIAVAAGGNWRTVDDYYAGGAGAPGYSNLREADAECVELGQNGSWHYLATNSYFNNGANTKYNDAVGDYNGMTAGAGKTAAKAILQDIYDNIPFEEMKRTGYDWFVRAPQ